RRSGPGRSGESRQPLHPTQQALVLPALREDLADVRPLERRALRVRSHHLRDVLPALVLLERLDLLMELEEVLREVGVDAEALEGRGEGMTSARRDRLDQAFAGGGALPEPERRLAHALPHTGAPPAA